ncbi:hypothetical protein BGZ95_009423 [Linnemannia exigua]|uniref:Uncharacterized protein n=1 Tax=Linnemannia exigua TaxID=604196 RepID=A0AAD4H6R5_9FUNG|nr:hypothetical protein BGZ95_009423 [Linnemannia exigua]
MPRLVRTCASLCSLVVALALLTLATTARKYSQHLLSHHQQRHPQQQHPQHQEQDQPQHHHRHASTLAGALFPVADEILAGKDYRKEPCPTACVHHRSDVYLAVTSVGEGFPRVQFTCSHAQHAEPTGTAQQSEGNHHNDQSPHIQGSSSCVNKQEPADPIPEHTPHAPAHGCDKCNHHEVHDRTNGARIYTDLHITANPHLRGSTPIDNNNNNDNNAAGYQPYYDFIFSPRERQSADLDNIAETHTTTMTFSDDNNDNHHRHHDATRRLIPLTSDQEPHNRVHILPVRDRNGHHAVPSGSFFMTAGESGATTPEPIATLAAPTSLGGGSHQEHGHGWSDGRMVSKEGDSASAGRALQGHENRAGPAAPTPEPFPAQTTGHAHTDYPHHREQEDLSIGGGMERAGRGQAHGHDKDKNPAVRNSFNGGYAAPSQQQQQQQQQQQEGAGQPSPSSTNVVTRAPTDLMLEITSCSMLEWMAIWLCRLPPQRSNLRVATTTSTRRNEPAIFSSSNVEK